MTVVMEKQHIFFKCEIIILISNTKSCNCMLHFLFWWHENDQVWSKYVALNKLLVTYISYVYGI